MFRAINNTISSQNETDTQNAANDLALQIAEQSPSPLIICLTGTLGAGKSVFARALIRALMQQPNLTVPSPTFTLVQTYETKTQPIYHYDLYRLEDPYDIYELGWEDSLAEGISIIEWPERLEGMKPAETLDINIEHTDNGSSNTRIITINHDPKNT